MGRGFLGPPLGVAEVQVGPERLVGGGPLGVPGGPAEADISGHTHPRRRPELERGSEAGDSSVPKL